MTVWEDEGRSSTLRSRLLVNLMVTWIYTVTVSKAGRGFANTSFLQIENVDVANKRCSGLSYSTQYPSRFTGGLNVDRK